MLNIIYFKQRQKNQISKEKNNLDIHDNLTTKNAAHNRIILHYYSINNKREDIFTVN